MRFILLVAILVALPLANVTAQSGSAVTPSVVMSPAVGSLTTVHQVSVQHLPGSVPITTALFTPSGSETVASSLTAADGSLSVTLQPSGQWDPGMYRWVVALAGGKSFSATFTANDQGPHLYVQPYQPSPTSAFNFVGIGYAPNVGLDLLLTLTTQGQRTLHVTADGNGSFSVFVWPQEFGFPFWSAGYYQVQESTAQLTTNFMVREHPVSAIVSVPRTLLSGGLANLHLENYARYRYLWGVYADSSGNQAGEFLVGPTTISGSLDAAIVLPALAPGTYLVATPYDWGETAFDVLVTPTATPTDTATPTSTPTATPTARPISVTAKCKSKKKAQRKKCLKHKI